jgi:hypothetical protein
VQRGKPLRFVIASISLVDVSHHIQLVDNHAALGAELLLYDLELAELKGFGVGELFLATVNQRQPAEFGGYFIAVLAKELLIDLQQLLFMLDRFVVPALPSVLMRQRLEGQGGQLVNCAVCLRGDLKSAPICGERFFFLADGITVMERELLQGNQISTVSSPCFCCNDTIKFSNRWPSSSPP